MSTLHKTFIAALVGTSTMFGHAHAVEFKISGQVSRMIVAPDDATGSEIQHQDIGWSGSRFRITGEQEIDGGYTVGFKLEQQLQSNPSFAGAGANQTDGGNDDFIDNRLQDLFIQGEFGKVSMGKGDGAADGGTEVDLSGTALSSSSNNQDNRGNYVILEELNGEGNVTWDSIFCGSSNSNADSKRSNKLSSHAYGDPDALRDGWQNSHDQKFGGADNKGTEGQSQ